MAKLPKQSKESVCAEADRIVSGERQADYGHPLDGMTRFAKFIEGILGIPVTPEQAGLVLVGLKMSRESEKHKRDNLVDLCGYAKVIEMTIDERNRRLEHLSPGGTQK